MSKRIREGDEVVVLSGNDRGKKGIVKSCSGDFALVQGVNFRTSYIKKNQDHPNGLLLRSEAPIRKCKLRIVSPEGVPVKLRARFNAEGEKELYYNHEGEQRLYRNIKRSRKS